MAKLDEKGPMQPPRRTCDVMKAASDQAPAKVAPVRALADAATQTIRTGQEDA